MNPIQAKAMATSMPVPREPVTARTVSPQFGNAWVGAKLATTDKAVSVFGKIVEVFLWAFLAQDVVGMWIPRIGVSLKRGRFEYDPSEDPQAKDLPMQDQVKLWAKRNIQGLNWPNFLEETGREFATGPGVLIIPAAIFSIARRTFGKGAVELGYGPLTQFGFGFMEQIRQQGPQHILQEQLEPGQLTALAKAKGLSEEQLIAQRQGKMRVAYQAQYKQFLKNLFVDQGLLNDGKAARNIPEHVRELITDSRKDFDERFGTKVAEKFKTPTTFRELIDQFADRYADATLNRTGNSTIAKHQSAMMEAIGQELETGITKGYNQVARLASDSKSLYKAGETRVKLPDVTKDALTYKPGGTAKSIATLMHDLHRFKDVVVKIGEEKIGAAEGAKGYLEPMANLGKTLINRLVGKKFVLAVGTTLMTGGYLIWLAKRIQSHGSYPGERLASPEGGAKPAGPAMAASTAAPAAAAQAPTASAVPQPAFAQTFHRSNLRSAVTPQGGHRR